MSHPLRAALSSFLILTIFLGACSLPSTYTPSPTPQETEEQAPYTAAASTISAQLTEIAVANTTGIVPTSPAQEMTPTGINPPSDTATLPSTSTPLPTNTPLPSDTPIPTDTLQPSETSSPTNTPVDTQVAGTPEIDLGEPDWQDTFNNASNWPLYNDEHVNMRITDDNQLEMTSLNADKWESWMLTQPLLENFYIETEATLGECSGLDRYGLMVRSTPNAKKGYFYGLTCDGRYSFRIWDGETFSMITAWTSSELINTGEGATNTLGLNAEAGQFTLYVNGNQLTSIQDDTFSEGQFGLFVGGPNTAGFNVWYDQISYWELPSTSQ